MTLGQLFTGLAALKLVDVARHVYNFFIRSGKRLTYYGDWAVVTGATDGIGKAYASELARQGLNVVIVARNEDKLRDVVKELQQKFPGQKFDHLTVDFSKFDHAARAAVKAKLDKVEVGILVNNVGLSYPFTKFWWELKDEEVDPLNEVNMTSTTWMTRIVLGQMGEDGKATGMLARRRGAIVNTSSVGGAFVSPLLTQYSASKAWVRMFSKGLHEELKPKGIDVQVQTPMFVATKMAKIRKSSLTVPSPEQYAAAAVRQIGYGGESSPYWAHALQMWFMSLIPAWLLAKVISMQHMDIRRRGMKKEAEQKKST